MNQIDLQNRIAIVTGGLTNDNGNERTITDTNATVSAKFYRVEITKP
jgi:uncharacterized protein (UPF0333 family)